MEILSREQIIEAVTGIKNGTIARVVYKTELPVKAAYKRQGYRVIKVVETSGRFGVNYNNISTVIARKALQEEQESTPRTNNYQWLIKNKVKHNTATNKDYIVMASFNHGHNTRSSYIIVSDTEGPTQGSRELLDEMLKELVINSYWSSKGLPTEIRTIAFENILRINNIGEGFKV